MSSFGEGIQATPCNLQHSPRRSRTRNSLLLAVPHSQEEVENFTPRVKRELNIARFCRRSARHARRGPLWHRQIEFRPWRDEMPLGKTGTCDDRTTPSKIGWFITTPMMRIPKSLWPFYFAGIPPREGSDRRRSGGPYLPQAP